MARYAFTNPRVLSILRIDSRAWCSLMRVVVYPRLVGGVPRRTLLARGLVERRIAGDPRFAAIDRAIAIDRRRIVFLLRLSPAVPFPLLNYLLGLTRAHFADFLVASSGMPPGTLRSVSYGTLAGDVAAAAGGGTPPRGAAYYAVLALGLVATIVVTARLARRALGTAA